MLLKALEDPNLGIVEFCADSPSFQDKDFVAGVGRPDLIDEFANSLRRQFIPTGVDEDGYCFWVRRGWIAREGLPGDPFDAGDGTRGPRGQGSINECCRTPDGLRLSG